MTENYFISLRSVFLFKFLSIPYALALCSSNCYWYSVNSNQIGDYYCDPSCMTQGCGFDGGDCEWYCSYYTNCTLAASNGVCDDSCNSVYCGYDHGDCGYCSNGCTLEYLQDSVCHPECNNYSCQFNNYTCECSPGCQKSMIENGICDWSCMNFNCSYDNGMCWNSTCSPECTGFLMTNYLCDQQCNTPECLYDNGYCLCAPGCYPDLLTNSKCDSVCSSKSCNYDNYACGDCAVNCFNSMINNGICESECNNADCGFDGNDCPTCAPGCHLVELGTCKPECLVLGCNFDPDCYNINLSLIALYVQKMMHNWNYPITIPSTCLENHGCYLSYYKWSWSCDYSCDYADCFYDYFRCFSNACPDPNCPQCLASNLKICKLCSNIQFYGFCIDNCPRYYTIYYYSKLNIQLCIPISDGSTEEVPDESFISAENVGQGDGSIDSPYNSLSYGLSQLLWKYSVVYLMKGKHYLTIVVDDKYLFDATASRPLYRESNKQIQIIVKPLYCSIYNHTNCVDDNEKITVMVDTNPITLDILADVTFENIIFDGSTKFSPYCSDCDYCKKITYSNGNIIDDHGNTLNSSSYVPQSTCDQFNSINFFEISPDGVLNLKVIFILECGN